MLILYGMNLLRSTLKRLWIYDQAHIHGARFGNINQFAFKSSAKTEKYIL